MTRAITLTPQPTHRATDPDGTTLAAYPAVIPGIGPAVHLRITDIDGCTLPVGDVEELIAALRVAVGQASPAMSNLPADSNRRGVTVDLAAAAIVPTDRAPTEPAWPATQHPSQANLPQFAVVEDPFRALNDRLVDERERDQRRLTEWTTARQQALNALGEDAAVDADLPALVEALIQRGDQAVQPRRHWCWNGGILLDLVHTSTTTDPHAEEVAGDRRCARTDFGGRRCIEEHGHDGRCRLGAMVAEEIYDALVRARAQRWGYTETLDATGLADYIAAMSMSANLRADVDAVAPLLLAQGRRDAAADIRGRAVAARRAR